jgi:O-antigen/teichoic acid export membrane protein
MIKNISTILSGTVIAQLIGLAAMPLLTRLYSPEDFGRYQTYLVLLNILLILVAFRYDFALLGAKSNYAFWRLFGLVLRITLLTSSIVALFLAFSHFSLEAEFSLDQSLLLFLGPAMMIGGLHQLLNYIPLRERFYRLSAMAKVSQGVFYVGSALGLALSPFLAIGMMFADLIGRLAASVTILVLSSKHLPKFLISLPKSVLRKVAMENVTFPLMTLPGALLSALTAAIMPFLFATHFGIGTVGQYALVERVVLLPVGVIALAIAQVFTGDTSLLFRENPLAVYEKFRRTVCILLLIALPSSVIGFLILPSLVPLVFGEEWRLAGQLAAYAMPIALSTFVAAPVNMILVIVGANRLQLFWEIGRFLFMGSIFVMLSFQIVRSPIIVMAVVAIGSLLSYATFVLLALSLLKRANYFDRK